MRNSKIWDRSIQNCLPNLCNKFIMYEWNSVSWLCDTQVVSYKRILLNKMSINSLLNKESFLKFVHKFESDVKWRKVRKLFEYFFKTPEKIGHHHFLILFQMLKWLLTFFFANHFLQNWPIIWWKKMFHFSFQWTS